MSSQQISGPASQEAPQVKVEVEEQAETKSEIVDGDRKWRVYLCRFQSESQPQPVSLLEHSNFLEAGGLNYVVAVKEADKVDDFYVFWLLLGHRQPAGFEEWKLIIHRLCPEQYVHRIPKPTSEEAQFLAHIWDRLSWKIGHYQFWQSQDPRQVTIQNSNLDLLFEDIGRDINQKTNGMQTEFESDTEIDFKARTEFGTQAEARTEEAEDDIIPSADDVMALFAAGLADEFSGIGSAFAQNEFKIRGNDSDDWEDE